MPTPNRNPMRISRRPATPISPKTKAKIDLWSKRISSALADTYEAVFTLGRLLEDCANEMDGDRSRSYHEILDAVGMHASTARRLRLIAKSPLPHVHNVNALPPSWGTLYELSQLDAATLNHLIERGEIHPEMTRRDAVLLRPPKKKASERGIIDALSTEIERMEKERNPHGRALLKVEKMLAKAVDPAATPSEAAVCIEHAAASVWKHAQKMFDIPGIRAGRRLVGAKGFASTAMCISDAAIVIERTNTEEGREDEPLSAEHYAEVVECIHALEVAVAKVKDRADRMRQPDENAAQVAAPRRRPMRKGSAA